MALNLNNYTNEYQLFNDQTKEIIEMYGLPITYIKSEGQNLDDIFGEYTHKKLNQTGVFNNFMVLPENSEEFENLGSTFSKFGFLNTEMFNCFVSASTTEILNYDNIRVQAVGDILVLHNGKKFEITFVEHEVKGTNNMFPYTNKKNVYMLKAKLWSYNGDAKEDVVQIEGEETIEDKLSSFNFTELDKIFNVDEDNITPTPDTVPDTSKEIISNESSKLKIEKPSPFGEWD